MGYFGGWIDNVIGRVVDAVLAVPFIVLGILLLTALSGTAEGISISSLKLIFVIGLAFTPIVARTVRSAVLAERDLDYVQAAKLRGERAPYIMLVEILPNVMGPIVVELTIRLGYAVFAVATLAFLGYGPQPPSPDWGLQIAEQYADISLAWWAVVFPALAIASLVVAINLMADTIAQVLDQ
jgi:peptide/nickel transport system permease protein